jgi:cytochrome c556
MGIDIGCRGRRIWVIGAALFICAAGSACAAGVAQIIHARQRHFHQLARTAHSLRDQIDRSEPNWAVITADANRIDHLASALPSWFPDGSGRGHGVDTRARTVLWTHPREFARFARRLLRRAQNLRQAADSHDLQAVRLGAKRLGQGCDSCHRRFRRSSNWWHLW